MNNSNYLRRRKGYRMQQVLVLSDSHGLTRTMEQVKSHHKVDAIIHCGDSELDANHALLTDMTVVRGNCDRETSFSEETILEINNHRFFVTHGHLYGVKLSLLQLQYRAEEVGANVVLFGHSHIPYCEQFDELLLINPGSIRQPRGGITVRSYVLLTLDGNNIQVDFYTIDGQILENFPTSQTKRTYGFT